MPDGYKLHALAYVIYIYICDILVYYVPFTCCVNVHTGVFTVHVCIIDVVLHFCMLQIDLQWYIYIYKSNFATHNTCTCTHLYCLSYLI